MSGVRVGYPTGLGEMLKLGEGRSRLAHRYRVAQLVPAEGRGRVHDAGGGESEGMVKVWLRVCMMTRDKIVIVH